MRICTEILLLLLKHKGSEAGGEERRRAGERERERGGEGEEGGVRMTECKRERCQPFSNSAGSPSPRFHFSPHRRVQL